MNITNKASSNLYDPSVASTLKSTMDSSNYPNFVDDQGGKSLLSKGALPQQTIMRYDVDLLTANWHDVESKHRGTYLCLLTALPL